MMRANQLLPAFGRRLLPLGALTLCPACGEDPNTTSGTDQTAAGAGGTSGAAGADTGVAGVASGGDSSGGGSAGEASMPADAGMDAPPNILVIIVDDLGYSDLSSYGAPDLESPNIDALVESGVRFTQFYSNSPVCSPTRAALLTGRFPDLVGVPGVIRQPSSGGGNWGNLSDDAVLVATPLSDAGYHTAIIGKWHLGLDMPDTPLDRGFQFFHGWLGDMMDDYYTHIRDGINWMRLDRDPIEPVGHATDLFTDWAIDYINDQSTQPEPFFLYLAYNAPHVPIQPPTQWVDRVKAREPGISDQRAGIVALIEHMDDGIGKVITALEDSGQRDDTLIIFVSDNGGQVGVGATNDPWRGAKGQMWEGGVRVPAGASWSNKIAAGGTSDAAFMTMDIFATVLEAAGVDDIGNVESRSFLPLLLGDTDTAPERDLVYVRREGGQFNGDVFYAVRSENFKLLQNRPDDPFGLYDLATDPGESQDLTGQDTAKFNELQQLLSDHRLLADQVPWQAN